MNMYQIFGFMDETHTTKRTFEDGRSLVVCFILCCFRDFFFVLTKEVKIKKKQELGRQIKNN